MPSPGPAANDPVIEAAYAAKADQIAGLNDLAADMQLESLRPFMALLDIGMAAASVARG